MASSIVVTGSYVQDLTFRLPEFPTAGQTLIGDFNTGPGGKGSNQAVAAARTGVPTAFIGATGKDAFAQVAKEFHEEEGIDSRLALQAEQATGTAAILVNDRGENEIVVALGANNFLSPADIPEDLVSEAQILVSQLEFNLEAAEHALRLARKNQVTTLLNPAPMRDDFPPSMLDYVDILVPNETEFAHLIRARFPEEHASFNEASIQSLSSDQLHLLCRDFGVSTFIITLGGNGCFVSSEDRYFEVPCIKGIEAVDTTGAGDAFVGGFSSGLVQFDGDIEKAVSYASVVAGLSVTKFGTAPAMPSKAEIDAEIEKQGISF
ncbi:MAG: ribokinase [Opitutales bacterium]|jgi:ribokinase|nr:ribokinase [Opitutales bacterium]